MSKEKWIIYMNIFVISSTISGTVFGWPSLVKILKEEGAYKHLCDSSSTEPSCPQQEVALSLIFSIGFFCTFAARLIMGWCLDRFGPKITFSVSLATSSVGSFIFALALFQKTPILYELGFGLFGFGGSGIHLSSMHISNLFPNKRSTIIASFPVALQISGFSFTILGFVVNSFLLSLWKLFLGYGIWLFFSAIASWIFLQPWSRFKVGDNVKFKKFSWKSFDCIRVNSKRQIPDVILIETIENKENNNIEIKNNDVVPTTSIAPIATATTTTTPGVGHETQRKKNIIELSFRQQIITSTFIKAVLFKCLFLLNIQVYLALVQTVLANQGDDGTYMIIFTALNAFLCIPTLPLVGKLLDKYKNGLAIDCTIAIICSLLYNILLFIVVVIDCPLQINIIGFILCATGRYLFFTFFFSHISEGFGFESFGKVVGVASVIQATVGLVFTPLLVSVSLSFGNLGPAYLAAGFFFGQIIFFWYPSSVKTVHKQKRLWQQQQQKQKQKH